MKLFYSLLFFTLALWGSSPALAKPWEETIADVEAQAEFLFEQAELRGFGPHWLGTAMNEIGVDQHECSILGRLLDQHEFIQELEVFEVAEPKEDMSEDEIFEMLISARMLENWAYTARRILDLSEDNQKAMWNLDCVGSHDIPATAYVAETKREAKFRVQGDVLYVLGDIVPGFSEDFAAQIASNPNIDTVALGSAGGSVYDALKAGQMIRTLGLNTMLSNNCYSACPLVFLGGVKRMIWSPYPTLGFHQMYTSNGDAASPVDSGYKAIKEYVVSMGAEPKFVVSAMFAAAPSDMFEPTLQSLCDSSVATWVQRMCRSPQ